MVRGGKGAEGPMCREQRAGEEHRGRDEGTIKQSVAPGRWSVYLDSDYPVPGSSPGDSVFYFLFLHFS